MQLEYFISKKTKTLLLVLNILAITCTVERSTADQNVIASVTPTNLTPIEYKLLHDPDEIDLSYIE